MALGDRIFAHIDRIVPEAYRVELKDAIDRELSLDASSLVRALVEESREADMFGTSAVARQARRDAGPDETPEERHARETRENEQFLAIAATPLVHLLARRL